MSFDYGTKKADGQYERHPSAVPEDRKFVRPVRMSYKHVGPPGPKFLLRDLTEEELVQYKKYEYVKFEAYPQPDTPAEDQFRASITGRFWTQAQLDAVNKGCGGITNMPIKCAETYAANPAFYGNTFCCQCGDYFPVGKDGEFLWVEDYVAINERVGT